jgi:hypothetical protein
MPLIWSRSRGDLISGEANVLLCEYGSLAHREACRREVEASSEGSAEQWRLVALAIARRVAKREGLEYRETVD